MSKTPRYGHPPIQMTRRVQPSDFVTAGDFCWFVNHERRRLLVLAIPYHGAVNKWIHSEWTIDHKNECGAQWGWNGNEDAPTLTPSLHAVGVWHGWVRDGKLVEA